MNIYLAGPMRGYPNFNFPAFDFAATELRGHGHTVFSPAERDRVAYGPEVEFNPTGDETKTANPECTIRNCMLADTAWICEEADAIALLPGWRGSKGANAELALIRAIGATAYEVLPSAEGVILKMMPIEYDHAPVRAVQNDAPRRPRLLPTESAARKRFPLTTGVLDYFPDALASVAEVSYLGNQKHSPGEELHWARGKSMDHADCILRHLTERGSFDGPYRHSACLAWRALASLQEELEADLGLEAPRAVKDAA